MLFGSDNISGVCPEVMDAILSVNVGTASSYGNDAATEMMNATFNEFFETPVTAFPVFTGTTANALSVAALCPSWGAVFCHESSHLAVDECGAPEFYTGGAKLVTLPGQHAKIDVTSLKASISSLHVGNPHEVQPAVISITQINEAGVTYSLDQIREFADIAHESGLYLHIDGSRFANACVALDCSPAEMTWQCGADAMSFGASKNGAMCAEAVVFFREELAQGFMYRHKRGGHLLAKMRFISIQLETYMRNEVWHRNAAHANAMAKRLSRGLELLPGIELSHKTEGNLVFVKFSEAIRQRLGQNGYEAYAGQPRTRLAASFDTSV
ncbi:MAG: low specificity L-threonine aldolase, partial [Candidatus Latescibacteria bacterium]|nr:low specificity L-threonine aldolase [Candidatus Latescibacterota bacterium]